MAVLPAFSHARSNSKLAALVSGDRKKLTVLGRRYKVPRLCSYDDLGELYESGEIDAVYIALPNTMHEAYTVQAAQAGLHVLCEKPMAESTASCRRMIEACRRHRVKLMIAYRLHFERATLEAIDVARSGRRPAKRSVTRPQSADDVIVMRALVELEDRAVASKFRIAGDSGGADRKLRSAPLPLTRR